MDYQVLNISIAYSTIGYIIYLSVTSSDKIKTLLMSPNGKNSNHIFFQRLFGVLLFGILPLLSLTLILSKNPENYGISFSANKDTWLWTLLLAVIILPVNFLNSKKPDNLDLYPQIRNTNWSSGLLLASALSWIAYLFSYEVLFRGLLLFSAREAIGYWPAIILNTGIYSLVHYQKGIKETLGAVPFGIIICVLTFKTGNMLIAFFTHTILALSNEWLSIHAYLQKVKVNQ